LRRKDKELTDREVIDRIIEACDICRLALAKNNVPYLVPVSFGYDGGAIYFHTALVGRKLEFIAANPAVCFEFEHNVALKSHPTDPCDWTFSYQCVIGYGMVSELVEAEEKTLGLKQVMRQYDPQRDWSFTPASMAAIRVWKIEIESLSGKQSKDMFQA
jgi:hypothetical protein